MSKTTYPYIKEICDMKGIKYTFLSDISTFIFEKDGKIRYFNHNKTDLNGHAIGKIIDNKYETYKLLHYYKLPIVKHININSCKITEELLIKVKELLKKFNNKLIIKPNHGSTGTSVYKITKENEIKTTLTQVFREDDSISISPFIDVIEEYRVFILDKTPLYIYCKANPIIIGDGKKTVYNLLKEFNKNYFMKHQKDIKNKDYIPKDKEVLEYDFRFNLSKGSIVKEIIDLKLKSKIESLAKKTAEKLSLDFVTIDIVRDKKGKLYILEINSGVSIRKFMKLYDKGKEIGYQIYSKAFDIMFKE